MCKFYFETRFRNGFSSTFYTSSLCTVIHNLPGYNGAPDDVTAVELKKNAAMAKAITEMIIPIIKML